MDKLSAMMKEIDILFENNCSAIAVFQVEQTADILFERASRNWLKLFGCTETDYGKPLTAVLPSDVLSCLPFQRVINENRPCDADISGIFENSLSDFKQVKLIPIPQDGAVIKVACYLPVFEEGLSFNKAMAASVAEFDALFEATNNAIWVTLVQNGSFYTERCSKALHHMFFPGTAYPVDKEKQVHLYQTLIPYFDKYFTAVLKTAQSQRFTLNINIGGFSRNIEVHLVPVKSGSLITKIVGFALDRTEEIDYLREVEYISQHDPLTGLYDRRYMDKHIARYSGKKAVGMFAAMFDLDGLKIINDAFGHAAGDLHILAAAQEISSVFSDCTVSRLGGDEFLVLGGGLSEEEVVGRLHIFAQPFIIPGCPLPVSISAGYAFYASEHHTLFHTIRAAEMMMYGTKLHTVGGDRRGYLRILRKVLAEQFPEQLHQNEFMLSAASWLADVLNLSHQERENLLTAIPLLAMGKLADQSLLLTKKQRSKRDTLKISTYEEMGAYIAKCAKLSEQVYDAIRYQHHRYDGKGAGVEAPSGAQIPLFGRMTALLLTYSAAAAGGASHPEIISHLQQLSGNQLDPQLVGEFLKIL